MRLQYLVDHGADINRYTEGWSVSCQFPWGEAEHNDLREAIDQCIANGAEVQRELQEEREAAGL